jgi:ATP-dependent exoDNAse (exonuclease V) alpha subunit
MTFASKTLRNSTACTPFGGGWSPQQDHALLEVGKWLRSRNRPVFRLFGFAGTGKTTLARHLAEGVDGTVLFAAFTAMAARVMRRKGCEGASTIHSLIYRPLDVFICRSHPYDTYRMDAEKCRRCGGPLVLRACPEFVLNRESQLTTADLLIVDECSMIDERMARDLLSFGVPVLVIGDQFQLPPPRGSGFFTHNVVGQAVEPDVLLTEVHRQARDNPIIRMSMIVRDGGRLAVGRYGDSQVVNIHSDAEVIVEQALVGRNKTRRAFNAQQRAERGFSGPIPCAGDKLVCLRNDYSKGLLNGSLWKVESVLGDAGAISMRVRPYEGGNSIDVRTYAGFFNGAEAYEYKGYDAFDYGYAMTVHKFQGSQCDRVLLVDESYCFREHGARWLYTGITRAAKQITVVVRA